MAKQTAVQWLMANLKYALGGNEAVKGQAVLTIDDLIDFEQTALEMEQQQMKEMYLRGIENYDPTFKRKSTWTTTKEDKAFIKS